MADFKTDGGAVVMPAGTVPRIALAGDTHALPILSYAAWEALVVYPDGHRRFHQCSTVEQLLGKVAGQLKLRYNIDSFEFQGIPKALADGEQITIGGIKYA